MKYTYDYPRPAVTVDAVILKKLSDISSILLVRRKNHPFQGFWSFPGGFVDEYETLEQAIERETREETGLRGLNFKQFKAFSDPDRDPRHRTITVVFYAFHEGFDTVVAGDDADGVGWFSLSQLPELAFDHASILMELLVMLK